MESVTINPRWKGWPGQLLMLVRREWWEHSSLRILPLSLLALVLAGSLLALAVPGRVQQNLERQGRPVEFNRDVADSLGVEVHVDGEALEALDRLPGFLQGTGIRLELGEVSTGNLLRFFAQIPEGARRQLLLLPLLAVAQLLALPLGLLFAFLAVNAWRRELLDRSIYFHKSLPVPPGLAVAAKALALGPLALAVMAGTIVLGTLIPLLVAGGAALAHGLNPWELLWGVAPLGQVWGITLSRVGLGFLLFLPVLAFLFALNVWNPGRRLAALVVVGALVLADRLYGSGGALGRWILAHLPPPGLSIRGPRGDVFVEMQGLEHLAHPIWGDVLSGLLVALLFFAATAWLLRWREER